VSDSISPFFLDFTLTYCFKKVLQMFMNKHNFTYSVARDGLEAFETYKASASSPFRTIFMGTYLFHFLLICAICNQLMDYNANILYRHQHATYGRSSKYTTHSRLRTREQYSPFHNHHVDRARLGKRPTRSTFLRRRLALDETC
jgi:hypothetical protein